MSVTGSDRRDWHPTNSRMLLTYGLLSRKTTERTLPFVTSIEVQFNVSLETLSEPFSVSTPVGDPVIARRVYKNYPLIVSQKVTSTELVDIEMVDLMSF